MTPDGVKFVTVRGDRFPKHEFLHAFMAAGPGDALVYRSLKSMIDMLLEGRGRLAR